MMPLRGLSPLGAGRGGAAESWWLSGGIASANCVAAYAAKGAASLAASYVNLTGNATYDAAPGVAPTWDAVSGWIFIKELSQHLYAGFIKQQGAWTTIVKFSNGENLTSFTSCILGASTTGGSKLEMWPDAGTLMYLANPNNVTRAPVSNGVLCVAGGTAYYNGSAFSSGMGGTYINNTTPLVIGARNVGGGITSYWSGYIQAFAIYNTPISAAQVLAVTNAMNLL